MGHYLNKRNICATALLFFVYLSGSWSSGVGSSANLDRTGSPMSSSQTCNNGTGCHTSPGSFTPSVTVQLISGTTPVTNYVGGNNYTVRITVSSSSGVTSSTRFGYQVVAVQSSTNNAVNMWGTMPSGSHTKTISGRVYAEQSYALPYSSNVVNIPWTAPAITTGNITFYAAGNVVNYNFQETGDNPATTSLTIFPTTPCTPPSLSTSITDVLCRGDSTGAITLTATGGSSPYIFSWTGPGSYSSSSQNISNLAAGLYNVTVTATGGCSTTKSATVVQPATKIVAAASSNSPVCMGDSLGLSGTGSGGTGALSFSWAGPGGSTFSTQDVVFNPAGLANSGSYILSVKDGNNCVVTDTVDGIVNDVPAIDSIGWFTLPGNKDSFIAVNPMYVQTYHWDFGDGATDTAAMPKHVYQSLDTFNVVLIVTNNCGADIFYKQVRSFAGIAPLPENKEMSIFPNPAADRLVIEAAEIINRINIYDMRGVKLLSAECSKKTELLYTGNLRPAYYLLEIVTAREVQYRRVEILR